MHSDRGGPTDMTAVASGVRFAADLRASPTEACASGWDVSVFQSETPLCMEADLATILKALEQITQDA